MKPLLAIASLTLLVAACSAPQATQPVTPAAQAVQPALQAAAPDAVVASLNGTGRHSARVGVAAPKEAPYNLQAIVHKWVMNDVFRYDVTLKIWNGSAYVDVSPATTVALPQKSAPKSTAVFTNLAQGERYRAEVFAFGDVGGGTAATPLNTDVPTTVLFDFTGSQDLQDTVTTSVAVTFDEVPFNGSGSVTIDPPATGAFGVPAGAVSGSAI